MAFQFPRILVVEEMEEKEARTEQRIMRRHLRDALNPFEAPDTEFTNLYRLPKEAVVHIIEDLDLVERELPNHVKVLAALHFFGVGSYQRSVGSSYFCSISQSSVSRCIREVSNAVAARLLRLWVKFPFLHEQQELVKSRWGLPGIVGAVDGTHIAIVKPDASEYPEAYKNRKGYYSVNTQIICDNDKKILSLAAKYPGSTHDAFMWRNTRIATAMRANYYSGNTNTWLLGDSGYPALPWLLTPYASPSTQDQEQYNKMHSKARSCVERTIGLLKGRFRCLIKDRVLHYSPRAAARIIMTCAVLHNICLHYRAEDVPLEWDEIDYIPQPPVNVAIEELRSRQEAQTVRDRYVLHSFGQPQ